MTDPQSPAPLAAIAALSVDDDVRTGLNDFVAACRQHLAGDLVSVVLYGSAAEGQMRPASDVNVLVILSRFDPRAIAALRPAYAEARAGLLLHAMFLCVDELCAAADAFAVKFVDILARRKVLFGSDPLASIDMSRGATVARIQQVLLNLELRLRERFVTATAADLDLVRIVGDAAPALRAAALAITSLQGAPAANPSAALWQLVRAANDPAATRVLEAFAEARQKRTLPDGVGPGVIVDTLAVIGLLRRHLAAAAPETRP